jgi:hypothetical protein
MRAHILLERQKVLQPYMILHTKQGKQVLNKKNATMTTIINIIKKFLFSPLTFS